MKIGTKSVLFGAHCFIIHPWFVAAAWWKLYGFPNRIQYWVAFFVHDIGYWGKPNMEREEGYFWIKTGGDWAVAQWYGSAWYLPGLDYHMRPETIEEIDERRVVREETRHPKHSNIYMCVVCGQEPVDAEDGFDTCPDCANRI